MSDVSPKPSVTRSDEPVLEAISLGGLGEFGMNMLLVVWGDTGILIDAGSMFPGPELLCPMSATSLNGSGDYEPLC